jgi:hypothetical protein
MGELVTKNQKDLFDWRKIIKRGTLTFAGGRAQYHLPYHKGDRFYQRCDILFIAQEVADPVMLLDKYITRQDALHGARVALFLCEDDSMPSHAWFDTRFFSVLDRSFRGHSARSGGATFYAHWASLRMSSKCWEDGLHPLGRSTSAITHQCVPKHS